MKDQAIRRSLRGAIYTRVSTEQGLEHVIFHGIGTPLRG
jgi:hypothetical protein